jgi:predicted transglutaminase-like cysteine proteinase
MLCPIIKHNASRLFGASNRQTSGAVCGGEARYQVMFNIPRAFLVGVFLIAFLRPSYADQVEPFGIHTVAIKAGSLVARWRVLKQQLYSSDIATITSCGSEQSNECAAASKLLTIIKDARQYQGKAFLGHLNRSINLLIKSGPGKWTGALDAVESGVGDCRAYAVTKYVVLLVAGFPPDQIRLVAVHSRLRNEDHLVVSVHQDDQWLILDNLHHLILQASEETEYEPLYVLDDTGVRQNLSLGELSRSHPTASKGHQVGDRLLSVQQ